MNVVLLTTYRKGHRSFVINFDKKRTSKARPALLSFPASTRLLWCTWCRSKHSRRNNDSMCGKEPRNENKLQRAGSCSYARRKKKLVMLLFYVGFSTSQTIFLIFCCCSSSYIPAPGPCSFSPARATPSRKLLGCSGILRLRGLA